MTQVLENSRLSSEIMPHFVASVKAVLSTMLGWSVEEGELKRGNHILTGHDVSGLIGFAGTLRGTIAVSLEQEVAFAAAEVFLGDKPSTINVDVMDLVAELANMVGGGAKDRLNLPGISLGLPTAINGKGHTLTFEPGAEVETLSLTCPHGQIEIQVAVRMKND